MATTVNASVTSPVRKDYAKNITIIGVFFFIFGFISWINGTLIPYLKIACELEEWQAYLVTFAFYISYTAMAIPSSRLLQKKGMIKGMSTGLGVMAVGCIIFIPAALIRNYVLFLTGLFFTGGGLTLLQTAVNPYITLLGPEKSAARRISIMGVCNKVAGILAPLIMGRIILKNSNGLIEALTKMNETDKNARLNELSHTVIMPYTFLTVILFSLAILIRYAHLPEIKSEAMPVTSPELSVSDPAIKKQFTLGFIAIFFAVGAEVLAGDTMGNYGLYHGLSLEVAKSLTSYTLSGMMIGYLTGIWAIPKYISQQQAFYFSSWLGLIITLLIIVLPGMGSLACVAILGLANAMLWPAIWPQALRGLTIKMTARGSAILIMGIAGGALMPLCYGWLAHFINNQYAYAILIPAYLFMLYYSLKGKKEAFLYKI
ncbi:sugar MFS transporter [Parafilimonas sp.]|uniref:sugar MFS transporter n=1 Tax=Parafilimonas sp. TaxID=1969739 RepID=UPI0039E2523E